MQDSIFVTLPTGKAFCTFGIQVTRMVSDGSGGGQAETFVGVPINTWGQTAKSCNEHLKEDSHVHVKGVLVRKYWDAGKGERRK